MRISDWSSDVCSSDLYARSVLEDAVEDTAIEGDHFVRLDAANAELGKLLFDLAAQVAVHGGARFDSEEGPEITHRNAVERATPVQIGRASCRGRVCQYV